MEDAWLSSDTARHDSVLKISTNSAKDNTAEEVKSQVNVSKISINSDLPFNNDANDDKQTKTLKNARIKHPQIVFFITY